MRSTRRFYARLGFRVAGGPERARDYLVMRAGHLELHFFHWPDLEPASSSALCHVSVEDADALHRLWSRLDLPEDGAPRLTPIADTPWGMRRFAIVDPDGNCISCGQAPAPQGASSDGETKDDAFATVDVGAPDLMSPPLAASPMRASAERV